ncbi:energy-coupling factor transporter transmembrane component T family protein [Mycoplasmoides pirum]|uniref:energy-coupling factor transporter transmembrane component T family protein n=1 Tax=Mycoplasmoides pirum TaxID=2122 RepID=UPI00048178FF|nr:energy-coupling factor transporter transmembrane component T [Mycoplasmoides pirum]
MSNFINGYILRNSFVHRINPVLKILIFISFVVLILLPLGFVIQSIIFLIVTAIFFVAKLPSRMYWTNLKTIIFMFLILLFINWFTYRNPGFIQLFNDEKLNPGFLKIGLYNDDVLSDFYNHLNFPNFFTNQNFEIQLNGTKYPIITYSDFLKLLFNNGFNNIVWNNGTETNPDYVMNPNYILAIGKYFGSNIVGFNINTNTHLIEPIMQFKGYSFSVRAIMMALLITQKIHIMIILAIILTSTSTSIELSFAIEQILSPFKIFKLPVNALAMTISIAIRFVPSLLLESQRILNAQASRGIDFKNGSFFERGHALVSLVVPMVSIAFRNASEISNAMEARAYNSRYSRTRYRIFKIHFIDWTIYLLIMLFLGFAIFATAKSVFFAFFGSASWMTQGIGHNVSVAPNS